MKTRRSTAGVFVFLLMGAGLLAVAPGPAETRAASHGVCAPEALAESVTVWVFFEGKGPEGKASAAAEELLGALEKVWNPRSLERRAKMGRSPRLDVLDLPVPAAPMAAVEATGAHLRAKSRWLNAVSVEAAARDLPGIAAVPGVREVARVASFEGPRFRAAKEPGSTTWDPLYGNSFEQLDQIQVPILHDQYGLTGQGVRIGFLDSRFDRDHECLQHVKVYAEWDFVDDDPVASYEPGDPTGSGAGHGTMTLSAAAGYRVGEILGPAFGAEYVLARTEDTSDELPVEEDYWVEGLEWAESLGVDIVSSSLGYVNWYEPEDLDGNTAVTTRAADRAAALGVLVVNSAGNGGESSEPGGSLIAPADGDSVLTVGAVRSNGVRASFSSVGPTADGRTKPDVMARGLATYVASGTNPHGYDSSDGTSFSCPLVAGLSALLLEAHPSWTPMDVIAALRSTATRAHAPDSYYGWGICQGAAAVEWAPAARMLESAPRLTFANPFSPGDRIRLLGGASGPDVDLRIYDGLGRLVFRAGSDAVGEGVAWDARDRCGRPVAPGVYFVLCSPGGAGSPGVGKIILVR